MKRMKKGIALLLAFAMSLGVAGCNPGAGTPASSGPASSAAEESSAAPVSSQASVSGEVPENSHYPVTITTYNYAGEEVTTTYEKAPERVVAVYQGCIETMIVLGLEDHVIASYGLDNEVKDEWKAGFEKMSYHTEPFAPDKEMVTLLEPDLIFSWGSLFGENNLGDVDGWISQGVNTLMNRNTRSGEARTLEKEFNTILDVGKIFNVEDKAQALVDDMKAEIDKTLAAVEGTEPVTVAVVQPSSDGTLRNRSANELVGDMVVSLGGVMAIPEATEVGKEDLLTANPDVIFVIYMPRPTDDSPDTVITEKMATVVEDPALATLSAVQNDRVYPIMLGDVYASAPRTMDGIKALAQGMYPDLEG